jgi:aspartyl-tRNA synthetase
VRALNARGCGGYSRAQIDELAAFVAPFGAKGLAYLALPESGEIRSSFAKFFAEERLQELRGRLEAAPGDLLLFVADAPAVALDALGRLRQMLAGRLGLADPDVLAFAWIIDFPFVTWSAQEKRWDPSHHLFTAPVPADAVLLDSDPGRARGQQYDVVLNGYETAGGSIRIHNRKLQEKVFSLIGLAPDVAQERFGHMLEAFEYGTPPHGGIASGIDRLCMVLAGAANIREVIPFPKNQAARDMMAGAPSPAEAEQLRELHLQIVRRA